jgi:outer membrane autotransporter protein
VEVEVHAANCTTVATNRVELAISNYLDRIMPTAAGDLLNVLGEFQSLSLSQFGTAFSSLSPDSYDNFTRNTFSTTHQYNTSLQYRMNNIRSHLYADKSGNEAPVLLAYRGSDVSQLYSPERVSQIQGKNGLWFDAFGQWGDQGVENRYRWNGGYTGYDYFLRGATLGFDHNLSDKFMAGASLGYSRSDIDLDHDQGSGYIKSLYGSVYGSYFNKNLYVDGAFSYGKNWYNNHRLITIGSLQRKAYSDHDGDLFSGYLGAGYYFDIKKWLIGPFASLQYVYLDEESFREKGADGLSLRVNDRQTDSLVSELGVRLARVFGTKCGSLIPEVSAAWLRDFDIDDRVITSSFAGSPGASFSIKGQDVEKNGATLGAGITFVHKSGLSTSLRYKGEFREKYKSNGVMGELRFTF